MNLKNVIDGLNSIAMEQPEINQYIKSGNIYDLNSDRDARFGIFCVTQGTHSYDFKNGLNTFNLVLYYVDRLKSDQSNKIEIQSTGIEVLKNILRKFSHKFDVDFGNVDFEVFTQSFSEICAGCYATISIQVNDNNCLENF